MALSPRIERIVFSVSTVCWRAEGPASLPRAVCQSPHFLETTTGFVANGQLLCAYQGASPG